MDLRPYTASGFPGNFDSSMADPGVAGIDRRQAQNVVRLCAETEACLYGDFSPTRIEYVEGSRPKLEPIAAQLGAATSRESVEAVMAWVSRNVAHPHVTGYARPDRALSEEQLIETGVGWCNEQTRVFIALCQVLEIPARLCFLFHENGLCGHTTAEAYIKDCGKWSFFDITFNVRVVLPDGSIAEARQLSGPFRDLAHEAYREPLKAYYDRTQAFVDTLPGWNRSERPDAEAGGNLLHTIGLCNYD